MGGPSSQLGGKQDEEVEANFEAVDIPGAYYASAAAAPPFLTQTACTCETQTATTRALRSPLFKNGQLWLLRYTIGTRCIGTARF